MKHVYKRSIFLRTVLFALGVMLCLPLQDAHAAGESIYTIEDVTVDVTADSAAAARSQAFAQARVQAFEKLTARLLSEQNRAGLEIPSSDVISTLIRDYEVTEEKLSHVRYVGTYTFRFQKDAIRTFLRNRGLSFSDVGSRPLLVLPFYQNRYETVLWSEENPWLETWRNLPSKQGLVPLVTPIGDIDDVSGISDNEALTYNPDSLAQMVRRYNAGEAIVLLAIPGWNTAEKPAPGTPPDKLTVMIYRTDRKGPEFAESFTIDRQDTGDNESLFRAAAQRARNLLQQDWKSRTVVNPDQDNHLVVRVRFDSMGQWLETQKALRRVGAVNDLNILSLSPHSARVKILFTGSERRLRLALEQADMTLTTPRLDFGSLYGQQQNAGRGNALMYDLYLNKYSQ